MNQEEFINKYGRQKLTNIRKHNNNIEENQMCITVDFNVPVPPKEEGMSNRSYKDYKLQRGEDLAYHFGRMIRFKWARCHGKADQCIVIVEPIIYKNEYRMRCELYAKNVDLYKDWLIETIKCLDYE